MRDAVAVLVKDLKGNEVHVPTEKMLDDSESRMLEKLQRVYFKLSKTSERLPDMQQDLIDIKTDYDRARIALADIKNQLAQLKLDIKNELDATRSEVERHADKQNESLQRIKEAIIALKM